MALTKVTGQVINTSTDVTVGVLTVTNTLAVGGTVSIGGTLTYEDVTNIDSVGLITARNGIVVGSGITLSKDGDVFFTGIATGNGSGLTALNASNIGSGTVPTARLGSGTASSSTFLRGDSTFQTVNTDLVSDTSPQLGGDLDSNGNNILLDDNDEIRLGTDNDLTISHNGSDGYIVNKTGTFNLYSKSGEAGLVLEPDGTSKLYYDGSKRIETLAEGAKVKRYSGGSTTFYVEGAEGGSAIIDMFADDGDDNADKHRLTTSSGGGFYLQNYASGSWETNIEATGNGAVGLYYDNGKVFETGTSEIKVERRIKINADGPGSGHGMSIGQWDGSNHRVEGDADRPMLITAYNSGGVKMGVSGNTSATVTGDGITFGGDTAAANALDDYEEGTWTPTCVTGTLSYGHNTYTKIGRMCYINTYVNNFSNRTSSNAIEITGLPYAPANESDCGACVFYRVADTDEAQIAARTSTSGNKILFLVSSQGGSESWHHLTHSDLNHTNSQIKFSIWYAVA